MLTISRCFPTNRWAPLQIVSESGSTAFSKAEVPMPVGSAEIFADALRSDEPE